MPLYQQVPPGPRWGWARSTRPSSSSPPWRITGRTPAGTGIRAGDLVSNFTGVAAGLVIARRRAGAA